jgi:hypothetical protein
MVLLQWAWVHRGARPGPTMYPSPYGLLAHDQKTGEAFSPIGTGGLPVKSCWPGGRQWSGRGANRQGGELNWWRWRGGAHRKACPRWRGSAVEEGRRHARAGVTGGGRAVGEGVLGGAVLGVGRGGRRGDGAGCPWWLSNDEHDGVRGSA